MHELLGTALHVETAARTDRAGAHAPLRGARFLAAARCHLPSVCRTVGSLRSFPSLQPTQLFPEYNAPIADAPLSPPYAWACASAMRCAIVYVSGTTTNQARVRGCACGCTSKWMLCRWVSGSGGVRTVQGIFAVDEL
jgi:hypothetical protein